VKEKVKITDKASDLSILKETTKKWMDVSSMSVKRHIKRGKPDSIRIEYRCGLRKISQWAAVNSDSRYAAHSAKYVLGKFYKFPEDFDYSIDNILDCKDDFIKPESIYVDTSANYPQVEDIRF